jgi:hypothetical protein
MPILHGCSTASEVTSIAPSKPITIDGKSDDWAGHLLYYRNEKLTIGVSNDKEFVYLCVMSSDQSVYRTIMMRGLTVWFDTTGGTGKYFGMRFPLDGPPPEMQANREEPPGSMDDMMKRRADDATKLAVVGSGKASRTEMLLPGKDGLNARISYKPGVFVYEMKVPLGIEIADGLKLGFSRDSNLGIRLETSESESRMPTMRDKTKGGMSDGNGEGGMQGEGGGMQGGMQGGGGRRGGGPGGPGGEKDDARQSQSIDFLMKVHKAY